MDGSAVKCQGYTAKKTKLVVIVVVASNIHYLSECEK